ncbi:MAG: response regulator [Anaerolineae bacterium]|nr:response regulator [Anaerolineae bacterium]
MSFTVEDVKEALGCLYDPLDLSRVALCRHFPDVARQTDSQRRAQAMRSILMNAVEALQPRAAQLPLTPSLRGYELLSLHYVQRLSLTEAADELNVSIRQAYRDLAQGLDKVTQYLLELAERKQEERPESADAFRYEIERVAAKRTAVDLAEVLGAAVRTLGPMTAAAGIAVDLTGEADPGQVASEASLLRQLLLSVLSWAVRHCCGPTVTVHSRSDRRYVWVTVRFATDASPLPQLGGELEYLCQCLDIQADAGQESGLAVLTLRVPRGARHSVLVIEDNPAVVELYRRMLQGTGAYEVAAAPAPAEAVSVAQSLDPDVIILDVLMPGDDGWALLRSLRGHETTSHIPVVVCSVFDEPELASSLGAAAFLRKPISSDALVQALDSCLSGQGAASHT